jgi:hypothetical protein
MVLLGLAAFRELVRAPGEQPSLAAGIAQYDHF